MNAYLRFFSGSLVAILFLGAALNFTLDPSGYFRNQGFHPGTFLGDRVWSDDRMAHDLSIDSHRPDTLIAGNSRVKHGFAVNDRRLVEQLGEILSLGLPGARFDELNRYIRIVLEDHAVRHLVIGLDLGQFLRGNGLAGNPPPGHWLDSGGSFPGAPIPLKKLATALWSKSTFLASVKVILRPHNTTLNGASNTDTKLTKLEASGHRLVTQKLEARMAKVYSSYDLAVYFDRLAVFDALLADTCLKNTDVRLFISPLHVRQLLLIRETGHLGLFFSWKAQLAEMVAQHQGNGCRVTLTDFSAISRYTSEPFPELGDKQYRMQWYWESSHYNHKMGQMVIERLWGNSDSDDGFGKNPSADNIAGWLEEERNRLNSLIRNQPILVREISDLIR
ncbi:hypothetical protein [Porticoccus sp.]|uniref:hypothetical protein n=1 Tax=Porticoccus sp. TaxID=2024853 RepID=UPI003F697365